MKEQKPIEETVEEEHKMRVRGRGLGAAGAFAAVAFAFFGCDDNGGEEDTTGPTVGVTSAMQDDYEGNTSIGLDVQDASGVGSVSFQYRAAGTADPYQPVAVPATGGSVALPSDVLDTRIVATDALGNPTTLDNGTVEVYALNAGGCPEIDTKLAAYLAGGDIHDWKKDKLFENGTPAENVTAEYAVLVKNPSSPSDPNEGWWVAVFYDGEGESADSGALKDAVDGLLANHFTESVVIGPAAVDRIGGLLDDALAANFAGGSYKSLAKSAPKEFF